MAKLFFKDKPLIGLDVGQTGLKIMAIDPKRWSVLGYGSIDLDPERMQQSLDNVEDEYLGRNLRTLLRSNIVGKLPSNHVVIGVPTGRTFSRTFTVPVSAEHVLRDAVETEVEQYIPLPMSALYVDYVVTERTKDNLVVMLSAVPSKLVDSCVAAAERANLRPVMVETGISAVARVLETTENGHLPTVIVDIGPASTDIAILDRTIRISGGLSVGGNTFTLDIARKLDVTLENAHQIKVLGGLSVGPRQEKITAAMRPSLERILAETRKVMRYYNDRLGGDQHKLEQVVIVGAGSNVPGIGEFFTNELTMPSRVAIPWKKLDFGKLDQPPKQLRPRFITVAGLAAVRQGDIWK